MSDNSKNPPNSNNPNNPPNSNNPNKSSEIGKRKKRKRVTFEDSVKDKLNKRINNKRTIINKMTDSIKLLNIELKEDINRLQDLCEHKYQKEITTTGCYQEYHYICVYCKHIR